MGSFVVLSECGLGLIGKGLLDIGLVESFGVVSRRLVVCLVVGCV